VPVAPPAVGGQQLTQHGKQVSVAARAGLDHREARGGMGHPHVQKAVARTRLGEERAAFRGEVTYLLA
jgi:2-hydroxychromene-2-carboxylate isomerase